MPLTCFASSQGALVFAAASLKEVLDALVLAHGGAPRPRISYAGSARLARQIEAGAPADLYISADQAWIDYLVERQAVLAGSRREVASNRLVLIAPAESRKPPGDPEQLLLAFAASRDGARLALADVRSVPAGRYAQAAMHKMGVWDRLKSRIAQADNVRIAMAWVARAEAPLGVVYATDARVEPKVRVLAEFPVKAHPSIRYVAAITVHSGHRAQAREFLDFMASAAGQAVFRRYGFGAPVSVPK
ncbi:MAG: molybdate ABC transporter substrate-binding protein [Burkholderiaceae bacterium]|nr:molybdate ABC transporter substrate-binding protein [Burkholderiaceae bacterium]